MRKMISYVLTGITVLSLCACGSDVASTETNQESTTNQEEVATETGIHYEEYEMGDTITDEYLEWSFEKVWNTFDFYPSNPEEASGYYEGTENMRFFYLKGKVKSLGAKEGKLSGRVQAKIIFDDKYEYSADIYPEVDNDLRMHCAIVPFETQIFYMCAKVPDELLKMYETVTFQWSYGDISDATLASEEDMKYHYQLSAKENRDEVAAFDLYVKLGGDPAEYVPVAEESEAVEVQTDTTDLLKDELLEAANASRYVRLIKICDENKEVFEYGDSVKGAYDAAKNLLQIYDGFYKVDLFGGGSYTIELKDGIGTLTYDHGAKYYVELMGWNFNGESDENIQVFHFTPVTDESVSAEEWFVTDNSGWFYTDSMDVYSVNLDGSSVMLIACEGNDYQSFNGAGTYIPN